MKVCSISVWRKIGFAFEIIGKIGEIFISAFFGNFRNTHIGFSQKLFSHLDSVVYDIFSEGDSRGAFHKTVKVIGMVSDNLRKKAVVYILTVMTVNIIKYPVYTFVAVPSPQAPP